MSASENKYNKRNKHNNGRNKYKFMSNGNSKKRL